MFEEAPVTFRKDGMSLKRVRWYLYGGALVGGAVSMLFIGPSRVSLISNLLLLLLCVAIDRLILAKAPVDGSVVFTLDREGIESPLFEGREKQFRWTDVQLAEVVQIQGQPFLQLNLVPTSNRSDQRSFLNGRNPSRPRATLQVLSPESQEALFDAVNARRRPSASIPLETGAARQHTNDLRESREMQDRLKALAPITWITWTLIVANTGVWLVMVTQGMNWSHSDPAMLYAWGANATSAVQAGEWWRLLTATFLHGGLLHITLNMIGLYAAGQMVERVYGHAQFLLLYLVTAVAGSVASLYFSAQTNVSVGASGAVFGVAGALLVAVLQHRDQLPRLFSRQVLSGMGVFVAYSFMQGFTQPNIDNAAHVGGLLAGAVAALVLPERFDLERFREAWITRSLVLLVLAATGLHWAARTAPPASVNLAAQMQALHALPKIAKDFDQALQALKADAQAVKTGARSALQSDEDSRRVHAPRWQALVQRLEATLPNLPPRQHEVSSALLSLSRAMHESLAMDSTIVNGEPVPIDPARAKVLQQQMIAASKRLEELKQRNTKQR
jgi:rhomboid protease GluP